MFCCHPICAHSRGLTAKCNLISKAWLRSDRSSTRSRPGIQCCAVQFAIMLPESVGPWCGSSPVGRIYPMNHRMPCCPTQSQWDPSPSWLSGRSPVVSLSRDRAHLRQSNTGRFVAAILKLRSRRKIMPTDNSKANNEAQIRELIRIESRRPASRTSTKLCRTTRRTFCRSTS